jgi:hypothetical protein
MQAQTFEFERRYLLTSKAFTRTAVWNAMQNFGSFFSGNPAALNCEGVEELSILAFRH